MRPAVGHAFFAAAAHKEDVASGTDKIDTFSTLPDMWSRSTTAESELDLVDALANPSQALYAFDSAGVRAWEPGRFCMVRKAQDATRNQGVVYQMLDLIEGQSVAVKQMPNEWVCCDHEMSLLMHRDETERPWMDIGCSAFLNVVAYPYACPLVGVYRDGASTYIVSKLASEGDLFSWHENPTLEAPGPEREVLVRPLALQILDAVRYLHDLSVVHRDLSLENILLSRHPVHGCLSVQIIDFGMASTSRFFQGDVCGKPPFQAPEMHEDVVCDAFLADTFSVGVALFAMLLKDSPWASTRPGCCKCNEFVRAHGFAAFLWKRKLRGTGHQLAQLMSTELVQLLRGLLYFCPKERLTLGETTWLDVDSRRSVWQEPWLIDASLAGGG
mmetsp:Transcript_130161/g.324537  ORF Transcript_130161/g.324537 Transcript_130161/m.324537 type:complete len:386 (-) Transcript_130161:544-1701(-)